MMFVSYVFNTSHAIQNQKGNLNNDSNAILTVKIMEGIGVSLFTWTNDSSSGKCPSRPATYTTLPKRTNNDNISLI